MSAVSSALARFSGWAAAGQPGSMPTTGSTSGGDGQWLFLATLFPHLFLLALEAMDLMDIIMMEGVDRGR